MYLLLPDVGCPACGGRHDLLVLREDLPEGGLFAYACPAKGKRVEVQDPGRLPAAGTASIPPGAVLLSRA